jgi:methylaspartate ammonia-lyase
MQFTRQQFNELGPFYVDDFPIDDKDQDFMFKVFNKLPQDLQGEVISHGFNDTVVRENILEYLCEKVYNMSIEQYYDSVHYEIYSKEGTIIPPLHPDLR